jgi:hypothetical protein
MGNSRNNPKQARSKITGDDYSTISSPGPEEVLDHCSIDLANWVNFVQKTEMAKFYSINNSSDSIPQPLIFS